MNIPTDPDELAFKINDLVGTTPGGVDAVYAALLAQVGDKEETDRIWCEMGVAHEFYQLPYQPLPHELRGGMDGYDPDRVNRVLGRVNELTARRIVCVWDFHDAFGFGGDSDLYASVGARLHECVGDLRKWLFAAADDPDAPSSPGDPASWTGPDAGLSLDDLTAHDGRHNYARASR